MNFLACDGTWSVTAGGINCTGTLHSFTSENLALEINGSSGISPDDSQFLYEGAISLFTSVFVFLVLKRLIK